MYTQHNGRLSWMQKDKGTLTSGDVCPCQLFLDPRLWVWGSLGFTSRLHIYLIHTSSSCHCDGRPGVRATSLYFLSFFVFALDRSTVQLSPHRHHAFFPTFQPLWFEIWYWETNKVHDGFFRNLLQPANLTAKSAKKQIKHVFAFFKCWPGC